MLRIGRTSLSAMVMVLLGTFFAASPTNAQATDHVTGTVTYREHIALPTGAVVTVQLLDVSLQDTAATVIAEQRITTTGNQVPFSFDLAYDPSKIQADNTYAVQARIEEQGQLMFQTTQQYQVITHGNPKTVDLVLERVIGSNPDTGTAEKIPASLVGTWNLVAYQQTPGNVQDTTGKDMTLLLTADGTASGSGGCNSFSATATANTTQAITITQMAATLKACLDQGVSEREQAYFDIMSKVTSYQLDGSNQLRLNVGSGESYLSYQRASGQTTPPSSGVLPGTGLAETPWGMLLLGAGLALAAGFWLRRTGLLSKS